MENQASGGRAAGSRGRRRQQHPKQNRNLRRNTSQNQLHRDADGPQSGKPREDAAHVEDSGRGGSITVPATPHSATPGGNRGAGGRGRGGRGGARQPSSEPAATSTMGVLGQASQPTLNSFSMSTGTTTSVTQMPGASNGYSWSHRGSALLSWCVGSTVGGLNYKFPIFVSIIIIIFLLRQASQPTLNSFSMSTVTTTSVTQMPGASNEYIWSHQGSALISWRVGSTVGGLNYILPTFVSIIIFFLSKIIFFLFSRIV